MDPNRLDREVRFRIYRSFATSAQPPGLDALAVDLDVSRDEAADSLDRLARAHDIALVPGTRTIWMAHPFSAIPTPYPVRASDRTYWGACAWDALGIPALLGVDSRTTSRCADCGEEILIEVTDGRVVPGDLVVHFLVPPKRFWEDIGFT